MTNRMNIPNKLFAKALVAFAIVLGATFSSFSSFAQEEEKGINYSAQLDTNVIVIGDQINLLLSIEQPKSLRVEFPVFMDSIGSGVEIIKQSPQDTIPLENGNIKVNKNFLITSFDDGVHKMNPFEFKIHDENLMNIIRTDTMLLGVKTFDIDTSKANFDIVMPIHTPIAFAEIAPWVFGGLIVAALIVLLILYLRKRKKNQPLFVKAKPAEPAHIIALRKLDEIKKQKLWETGKVKQFHSDLTDTIRYYLDERFQLSTQESTTDEILKAVNAVEVNSDWHAKLKDILERADLAKFAKFTPLQDENELSLKFAYKIIETTIVEEAPAKEEKESIAVEETKKEEK
ncbi:hypothetical protein GQR60_10665 [Labilibaculum sp. A4]|uniref:hypothetical protein n=1 Tax=Labilibaculum euxinus TaxID=2686357 RepID=UPI000F61A041|nr:hypothetical protein [Labilibaculum euxinus]MDQ1771187.1 hypothetical protein [Labilibaculum euxinus]MWN76806.1 hypothetical protein [Labilibaculum euxinus]